MSRKLSMLCNALLAVGAALLGVFWGASQPALAASAGPAVGLPGGISFHPALHDPLFLRPVGDAIHLDSQLQTTASLSAGWNLVALPLQPGVPYTAQSLLNEINSQGGSCTEIDRWLGGGWDAHLNGLPSNDFDLLAGAGYFVKCSAGSSWSFQGQELSAEAEVSLQAGWSLIGVPYPPNGYTAQSYLDGVNSHGNACTEIDRWLNGGWDTHHDGLPFNNFSLQPGKGYFLRCSAVNQGVDLSLLKSAGSGPVQPGQTILYTLTYANSGYQAAEGVVITDTLPANTSFNAGASSPGWQSKGAGKFAYNAGNLAVGAGGSVKFAVTVANPLPAGVNKIKNTATIGDDGLSGPELDPTDNTASAESPLASSGPTEVCGAVSANTTWTKLKSPYIVTCNTTVNSGVTLTVEAGAIVKFKPETSLAIEGTLKSQGTAENQAYFTSYKDDSAGGDTNGDGSGSSPAAGDWTNLYLGNNASASFDYAIIRYGGSSNGILAAPYNSTLTLRDSQVSFSQSAGIWMDTSTDTYTARLTVQHSTISDNSSYGIYMNATSSGRNNITLTDSNVSRNGNKGTRVVYAGTILIRGNTFNDNDSYAFCLSASTLDLNQIYSNSASGNLLNGLHLGSDTISGKLNKDMPYIFTSVTVPSGSQLTAQAGAIVKINNGTELTVMGSLVSQGTTASPVYFTSYKDDSIGGDTNGDGNGSSPARGDWTNIYLASNASASFDHAIIRYGGSSGGLVSAPNTSTLTVRYSQLSFSQSAGIWMDTSSGAYTASLTVDHSIIRDNSSYGIYMNAASSGHNRLAMTYSTVSGNSSDGIHINLASDSAVHNSNIFDNTGYGIYNATPTTALDARSNYWGSTNGPAPYGSGDSINTYEESGVTKPAVLYDTWLIAAVPV